MLRDLWTKYRLDLSLLVLLAAAALAASVFAHAATKPVTRLLAYAGPVIFTTAMMALIVSMTLMRRYPVFASARRILIDVCAATVVLSIMLSRAEMFYAPVALAQHVTPARVTEQIATDEDVERYQAWARIVTLSTEEKNEVATDLGHILLGDDEHARESAVLTLEYPLRRHTITTLITMGHEIQAYLEAKAATLPPTPAAERAGAFTAHFVEKNYKSILKALGPKQRDKLPAEGVDTLMMALATNEPIGQLFLRGFAEQGDDFLKAKAQATLALISPKPTT